MMDNNKMRVVLPVTYKVYILGRGYVNVVDNKDLYKITTNSVVLVDEKRIAIIGVEMWKHFDDIPDRRQGIVTREPIAGKTITIEL